MISYEKYLELQDQKDCVGSDRDRSPTDAPLKAATEPKRGERPLAHSFSLFSVCLHIFLIVQSLYIFSIVLSLMDLSGKMILPFEPLTVTFEDLRYYVDIPSVII